MGRQIFATLLWTVILFCVFIAVKYFTGVEEWFKETLVLVITSAIGYFFGYGQRRRDENR